MNLIVEKTRKKDVSNIHGCGNNNKQACRPSDRLTGVFAAAHELVHGPEQSLGLNDSTCQVQEISQFSELLLLGGYCL